MKHHNSASDKRKSEVSVELSVGESENDVDMTTYRRIW